MMWIWCIASAANLALAGAGSAVKDFTLTDLQGGQHTLASWEEYRGVVLIFLATECPVSNGYAPEYGRLARRCAENGIAFLGVHSDPELSAAQAVQHAREYRLGFPILMDPGQELARATGARTTPEAVVLSPRGQVLYRGRIDDRYSLDGRRRDVPRSKDLEAAIEAVMDGLPPAFRETKAFGCPLPRRRVTAGHDKPAE